MKKINKCKIHGSLEESETTHIYTNCNGHMHYRCTVCYKKSKFDSNKKRIEKEKEMRTIYKSENNKEMFDVFMSVSNKILNFNQDIKI
jgi:hypothetical protein